MAATIRNATPYARKQGIRDLSGRPPVREAEQVPTHLPHIFTFAERGPLEPQLVSGSSLTSLYGVRTTDLRAPFTTHQTVLMNAVNGEANAAIIQRVVPEDIPAEATLALGIDVLEEDLPVYERNPDGSFLRDQDGNLTETGDTVPGVSAMWTTVEVTDGERPSAAPQTGSQTDSGGNQSTFYPIYFLKVASQGSYGNRVGIRMWAPTAQSTTPTDVDTVNNQGAFLYRLQLVERPVNMATPNVTPTLVGDQFVEFALKDGVINERVDQELSYDKVVIPSYEDLDTPGFPPVYSPFSEFHVYKENLDTVLKLIYDKEVDMGELPVDDDDYSNGYHHLINIHSAMDVSGFPYHTLRLKGPGDGGLLMTENTTHYASGGGDGTLTYEEFDKVVGNVCANYDSQPWHFMDTAQYPQSIIWDSGFTLETKKKLLVPMGLRKDIAVALCTQDVLEPQLSASEETSMAIALRAAARVYPESETYGTPTCRALVFGQSGRLINSQYTGLLPLTIEYATKFARYMGASNGSWREGQAPNVPGINRIEMFRDVNNLYKPERARHNDWDTGLIWAQRYDRSSLFYPALQTVYNDDTSVLNSAITMLACVELEKVCDRVWRDLTGIDYLTNEQFIERSDRLITAATNNRFDGRFIIEPNTTITGNDAQRGYSWSTDITIYAANMKTVGTYTITSRRIDDYQGQ